MKLEEYLKEEVSGTQEDSLLPAEIIPGDDRKEYDKAHRLWLAAPCMAKSRGGRLFCSFAGDNDVSDEGSHNYGKLLISEDDGKTWREDTAVVGKGSVRISEPNVWTDPRGRLWFFWCQQYGWWDGRGGLWCSVCENPDGENLVWSKPRRLADGVMNSRPVATRSGRWLYPLALWKNIPARSHPLKEMESTFVYYSDDEGQSIHLLSRIDIDDTSFDENQLCEIQENELMMVVRCKDNIKQTFSHDNGLTWETPRVMCKHCSARSFLGTFPSGHILHINCDDEKQRTKMTAFLSTDGGKSWQHRLLLDERSGVSYPGGFIDENGVAVIAHDRNRNTDMEICYSQFTEKDLLAGKPVDSKSFLAKTITKKERSNNLFF